MKKLMPFLKSRWPIILLGLIAVAALPALWFVSSGMASKAMETFQKKVETDYKEVTSSKVPYGVTAPTGEKLFEKSDDANSTRIQAYKALSESLQAKTSLVSKAATDLNTDEGRHKLLIEGLFPAPSDLERLSKPKDFARMILQTERPRLLASIHAGTPPPAADVGAALNDLVQSRREEVRQNQGRAELDSQEMEMLTKDLLNLRLSRYQSRAAEVQVYADPAIFDEIPADAVDVTVGLATAWDWQERLWAYEDVLRSVARANGEGEKSGGQRGVPGSVVKRITKLSVEGAPYAPASGSREGSVDTKPFEAGTDRAPSDLTKSITGRFSGPGSNNRWYDVRMVTVEMVADARRLPAFIDALASTNFMTVVDVDLTRVEQNVDLRDGYFYGDEPVVKVTMVIESVWLREWREPWMPLDVKRAMAMDKDAPAAAAAAPAASRRAPPRTPGRPAGGDDLGGGGAGGKRGGRGGD